LQITSRYEGVIKKLHYQADDTVPTGQARRISSKDVVFNSSNLFNRPFAISRLKMGNIQMTISLLLLKQSLPNPFLHRLKPK